VHTYGSALALVGVVVPDHLSAQTEVPVLTGPQAQGDLLVVPEADTDTATATATDTDTGDRQPVTADGIQVVHGEATGNTHWLHAGFDSPGVTWRRRGDGGRRSGSGDGGSAAELVLGHLHIPEGQSALLIHTDEHGANGIGPGSYAIRRKRQLIPEIRQAVVVRD